MFALRLVTANECRLAPGYADGGFAAGAPRSRCAKFREHSLGNNGKCQNQAPERRVDVLYRSFRGSFVSDGLRIRIVPCARS